MHSAFTDVLWIVCGIGIIAALLSLKGSAKEWDAYSKRGLYMESVQGAQLPVSQGVLDAEREDEIRQMVEAANNRRVRRGESELDVEGEIVRLTVESGPAPAARRVDPELEDEVRTLVELRNQRRIRKGQAPLDVDAEIRRELSELGMLQR